MGKSKRKKKKGVISAKKPKKTAKGRTTAGECVSFLLELHKLQAALLTKLAKEVQ